MFKSQLIGITCFTLCFAGCGSTDPENSEAEWKTYDDKTYSVQYPEDWEMDNSGKMNTSLILMSERSSDQDEFQENVTVMIQNLEGQDIDLDAYTRLSEEQIKMKFPDRDIIESTRIQQNGSEFHKLTYGGIASTHELRFMQRYTIKNDAVYLITFTGVLDEFDHFEETAEKILNSFELK